MTATAPALQIRKPFLTAEWRWLVMLNYEVDADLLQPFIPKSTELDCFEGKTYVSVVGFLFLNTRVLGWPVPFHRHFEEVNLRFYVRREVEGEARRGVCFVKELVPKWAIATVARWAYNEPYASVPMRHSIECSAEDDLTRVEYRWRWGGEWNSATIVCDSEAHELIAGSHEEFIAEHYWGYCPQRDGGTVEYQVEHPRWQIYPSRSSALRCDVAALYGEAFAEPLAQPPASAFLADGSSIAVAKPARVDQSK